MNALRITPTVAILALVLTLTGCAADPNYESPEKTVETYLENGPRLKNAVDIPAWNFAWNGLSKTSQQWFEDNWEEICERPGYREACGEQTNPEKQKMVAFGGAIASRGPGRGDRVDDVEIDGDAAEVTLKNWDGALHLVKEGKNWKLDGLFGVEEMASAQW